MKLVSLNYSQFLNDPREWKILGLDLGPTNLLVGKNAAGKSRTLSVINALALLLSGKTPLVFQSGTYDAVFESDGKPIRYKLKYENRRVQFEEMLFKGRRVLSRKKHGVGSIRFERSGKLERFQTPDNQLAAVARRDSLQHPYFELLHQWASSLRFFQFGSTMGRDVLEVLQRGVPPDFNPNDTSQTTRVFRVGLDTYRKRFKDAIKKDMASIGYKITDIGVKSPSSIILKGPISDDVACLFVQEADLKSVTEQSDISQGMFRALSVLIQLNYFEFSNRPSCILIDDVGEGLDFDRSCLLIKLIMDKASKAMVQLIMSTNDRFVMNAVPLEAWSVIQRKGGTCLVRNHSNSKKLFDDFKFTGLNNFDLLASNFLSKGSMK